MRRRSDSVRSLSRQPSAFVPVLMSLAALTLVAGSLVTASAVGPQHDEGAVAHLWQLLMVGQLPVSAYFLYRWLPRAPRASLGVLALQLGTALGAIAPVYLLGL